MQWFHSWKRKVEYEKTSFSNVPFFVESFPDQLKEIQQLMELELDRWLPDEQKDSKDLSASIRYSTLGAGKRLRPALCLMSCKLIDGEWDRALAASSALECIHAYSLIHDDLPCMDDDDLRRGKPTNHKVFGEAMAVLAGDGLQTLAFEILVHAYSEEPQLALDLVRLLSGAAGVKGMVEGQALDINSESPKTEDTLELMHRKKTGALLRASVLMGARCGGLSTDDEGWHALDQYSRSVGLAFQVMDDILDATASTEELGKTAGKDEDQHKLTYVKLIGLDGAQKKARALEEQALQHLKRFGPEADLLRDLTAFVVERKA